MCHNGSCRFVHSSDNFHSMHSDYLEIEGGKTERLRVAFLLCWTSKTLAHLENSPTVYEHLL